MTDVQKMQGASMVLGWAQSGSLTTNLNAITDPNARQALIDVVPGMGAYMHYGQIAEAHNLNYSGITGIDVDSAAAAPWIEAYGSEEAFLAAQNAAETCLEEIDDGTARVREQWDDMTDEVIDGSKRWRGSARDVAAAYKDLNSTLTQVANNQYYREQYRAGKRDDETIEAIASMTG